MKPTITPDWWDENDGEYEETDQEYAERIRNYEERRAVAAELEATITGKREDGE